jgi:hypothetical protein
MSPDQEREPAEQAEIPRQGFWAALPRRSLSRVLLLLAMLVGILYLRQRAASIAACMSQAFLAPAPQPPGVRLKAPVVLPPGRTGKSP